jgi:hypothetical protein
LTKDYINILIGKEPDENQNRFDSHRDPHGGSRDKDSKDSDFAIFASADCDDFLIVPAQTISEEVRGEISGRSTL